MHKRLNSDIYSAHKPPRGLVAVISTDMLKSENQSSGAAARGFLRIIKQVCGCSSTHMCVAHFKAMFGDYGIRL